jgi:hypothetical protein
MLLDHSPDQFDFPPPIGRKFREILGNRGGIALHEWADRDCFRS